ncbi:MAG: hypothetical protein Ct9H300mP12_04790 [Acidimicrobiales bacterium]|nr:MAG: hypothetical protein Ct9H300mP12_04790 [Acidimicrobiales bacterium]
MRAPTDEDLVAVERFVELGADMIAVSFVRSAEDLARVPVEPHPTGPIVVAKIETRAAIQDLPAIIEASGAVMVARATLVVSAVSRNSRSSRRRSFVSALPLAGRPSRRHRCSRPWLPTRSPRVLRPPTWPTPSGTDRVR